MGLYEKLFSKYCREDSDTLQSFLEQARDQAAEAFNEGDSTLGRTLRKHIQAIKDVLKSR